MEKAGHPNHSHEKRYGAPAERLRSPERMALLEVSRVVDLCLEGINASRALDVGTGTGVFAEAFAARGLRATGIDPNPDLLEAARRLVPGVRFQAGTAEKLAFEDGSFDLIMLSHVLHETDDPAAALTEARRVARLRVCVLEWPYVDEDKGPPLAHRLRPAEIEALARRAGFSVVQQTVLSRMLLYRLAP
jgi:ubiquinone/menaquinone biosynthesis C-methylase UbiE